MIPRSGTTPPAPAAGGRARLPLAQLGVLAAAVFAAVTTEVMPVGLLPQLAGSFGVSQERIGWWMSAYAFVVAAGAIPVTALLARWPKRRALLVLLALYAASDVLVVVAPDYGLALVARLLGGLAHAGIFSVVVAAAVALVPRERAGRAVALVNAGVTVALALGVPLATAAGTAWGWRWSFGAAAAVLAALVGAVALLIPGSLGVGTEATTPTRDVLESLRGPALVQVAAVTAVLTLGHYCTYTYITPLVLRGGIGTRAVSLVLFGYGFASLVGLLVAGAWADRRPVAALRIAIGLIAACLLALGPLTGAGAATVVVVAVWGAAFGSLPTLLQTAALRVASAPDAAPAVVNAMFNVGIAAGAGLGGLGLRAGGAAALTSGSAALVGVALLLTLRRPGGSADRHRGGRPAGAVAG